jgi:hypothetical protein
MIHRVNEEVFFDSGDPILAVTLIDPTETTVELGEDSKALVHVGDRLLGRVPFGLETTWQTVDNDDIERLVLAKKVRDQGDRTADVA